MAISNALLIFAKAPQPGRVKTRLLGAVSANTAAELHKACLEDTLLLARRAGACDVFFFGAGDLSFFSVLRRRSSFPRFPAAARRVFAQRGPDLGARLEHGFRKMFRCGYRKVVVIGADTPWMGAARIRQAFRFLSKADVVLGPSADGGYYLLGLRRCVPQLFRGISWGTSRVLGQTLRAVSLAGASKKVLPLEFDLDRPADLIRASRLLSKNSARAPHLARMLKALRATRRRGKVRREA